MPMRHRSWLLAGILICICAPHVAAQATPGTIIPAPPVVPGAAGGASHSATQNPNDPTRAHDATTGQNLTWDGVNKTWIDATTKQPIPGKFRGRLAKDGTVIPAPPPVTGATPGSTHSATQDATDPERAHDATSGEDLTWDRKRQTWVDAKTKRPIPGRFRGKVVAVTPIEFDSTGPVRPRPTIDSTKPGLISQDTNFPPPRTVPRKPPIVEEDTNFGNGCGVPYRGGKFRSIGLLAVMPIAPVALCHPHLAILLHGLGAYAPGFAGRVADQSTLTSSSADDQVWGVGGGLELSFPHSRIGFGLTVDENFSQRFKQMYLPMVVTEPTSVHGDVHGTFVNAYVRYLINRPADPRATLYELFAGPTWAYDYGCYRSTYMPLILGVPTAVKQTDTREESGFKFSLGAQVSKPLFGRFDLNLAVRATTAFKSEDADQNLRASLGVRYNFGRIKYAF
jgi:hypothetical protein